MSDILVMNFPPYYTKNQIKQIKKVNPDILIFDDDFITPLNEFIFSDSIIYLDFGKNFNKSLKNIILPKYLRKLRFGDGFLQSLDYVKLPDTLEIIELGANYNVSLFCANLPIYLKELILNDDFNCPIPRFLPKKLEKIVLGTHFDYSLNNFIVPKKLKYLRINGSQTNTVLFDNLPRTMEYLEIVGYLGFDLKFDLPLLERLIINNNGNVQIDIEKLPKLKYLKCCGAKNNEILLNTLSENVRHLEIINKLKVDLVNLHFNLDELYLNFDYKENELMTNLHLVGVNPIGLNPIGLNSANIEKQTNLPVNLKKLKLKDIKLLKFIEKIPYDCLIVDSNDKPFDNELIKQYIN